MKQFKFTILIFFTFLIVVKAQITGIVFRDYNANGQRDSTANYYEPGAKDVLVKLTDRNGVSIQTMSNGQGKFSLNPIITAPYRIEFTHNKTFDFDGAISPIGTGSKSAVQFIYEEKAFVTYAINYPQDYSKDPTLFTPCYVIGNPLDTNGINKDFDAFVSWDLKNGGQQYNAIVPQAQGGTANNLNTLASGKQIGSCWGVAHQKNTDIIFTSAVLKRHAGIGPKGYGGLYMIQGKNDSLIYSMDLNSIGIPSGHFLSNSERMLPSTFPLLSTDSLAFSHIGKIGYGGMDLSEDGKTLYIVSLYTRKLYSVFINNPFEVPDINDVDSFNIPDPLCHLGTYRPWALKMYRGKIYIGVVCDGSGIGATSNDLNATVYEFNPAAKTFTSVLHFDLNYKSYSIKQSFLPWTDVWDPKCLDSSFGYCDYPQAILSDIEFDGDDHLVVGILDRLGMQGGFNQKNTSGVRPYSVISLGDILRSTYNPNSHQFDIENNAFDGSKQTAGQNTGFGPGGGEYYHGDNALTDQGSTLESESSNGALAHCPGYGNMITTSMAPYGFFSNGIIHLDNTTGNWTKRFQIIPPDFALLLGKSNALGDLKIRTLPAPIEIGNYAWKDLNKNGIQDPIEPSLKNITIQLIKNNQVIASALTNENGNYLFSSAPAPLQNDYPNSFIYDIKELSNNCDYTVRIPENTYNLSGNKNHLRNKISVQKERSITDEIAASMLGPNIDQNVHTGMNGDNNHTIDFRLLPLTNGLLMDPFITVSECDGITNSFNLHITLNAFDGPVGDVVVELSTGQKKTFTGVPDGLITIDFINLEVKGLQNVGVNIYYVNNPAISLNIANAFDQPLPCCVQDISLCSNRESQVELVALPDLTYYAWYDSTSHTLMANTQRLILDKSSFGLADLYEAYYFIGVNNLGDTLRQYCNYKINIIECCALQVTNFFQTDCNNNATLYDPTDDYFAVLISAENPEAGPSNRYEVIANNVVIGNQAYGSPILVGNGGLNPDFISDGITKYKVIIRDVDNILCLDSVFTTPVSCPIPRLTVNKTLQSNQIQSDASYNIVYRIEVKNEGTELGTYSLTDDPGFDDDVKVLASFYTTNIPNKGGNALTGTGPWTLVSNQTIAPGVSHVVMFTINLKLDFSVTSTGNRIYTSCGTNNTHLPNKGEGLFNRALLDYDANGTIDFIDTSCTDIPYITIDKQFLSSSQTGVKSHHIQYRLIVSNFGGAVGQYNLIDRPGFDDDIVITNAQFQSNIGLNGILSNVVPLNGWNIAINRNILPLMKDTFIVDLDAIMDLDPQSLGNNIYRICGFTNPSISRMGEGIFNVASVDLNNDFKPERRDTTCNDLSQISQEKFILSQNYLIDDRVETNYLILVRNLGAQVGTYRLIDQPHFDDDLIIEESQYRINSGVNQFLNNNPGITGWILANNRSLNGFGVDSFYLTMVSHLDLEVGSSGDQVYSPCSKNANGAFESGHGLFNESRIDVNADGKDDQRDTVCTDYEIYDLALRTKCLSNVPILSGEKAPFRISVFNQGNQTARSIEVVEYLPKAYDFDPILNPKWTKLNDSTYVFVIDSLVPQDSFNIDIILRVNKYLQKRNFAINSAEIASFVGNQYQPILDYDSTPDRDRTNDNIVLPNDLYDDYLLGRRKFIPTDDEDDHDVAIALFFDLALTKKVVTQQPYHYNDNITFSIKVYNQGSVTAKRFDVIDYIPSGYEFIQADNLNWLFSNNSASYDFIGSLMPNDSIEIFIVLKLLPNQNSKNWINESEIASASIFSVHNVNISIIDFDSVGDTIISNDIGGEVNTVTDDLITDDSHDFDHDGVFDEDDHDPAVVYVWDLALKKILNTPPPHLPNQTLEFILRVFNQGTDTVGSVSIVDYIPIGLEFSMVNASWVLNGNQVNGTFNTRILPGDSAQYSLYLRLKPGNRPLQEWINFAEILGSKNSLNQNRTGFDIDSREMSDSPVERSVKPGDINDNNIYSIDLGGEEDDHDPAKPVILDLALKKIRANNKIIRYGDTLDFNIIIYNQGFIAVSQVSIIDYLPDGLNWINQINWSYNALNRTAQYIKTGKILPGDSVIIPIKLIVNTQFGGSLDLVNYSEIFNAVDTANRSYTRDIDSFFDMIKINDAGGNANSNTDNAISDDGFDSDHDGITDEDDSDPAIVTLVDFALRKEIVNPDKGNAGDTTRFKISVFNQGNVTSGELTIKDYINKAFQFLPSINPNWTISNNDVIYTFNKPLLPGEKDSVYLDLLVLQDSSAINSYNWSEIVAVKDINLVPIGDQDADSRPASDAVHERSIIPNSPDDDRINGGGLIFNQDEDDHDVAGIDSKGTIGDMVWHDKNANGRMDAGEEGIEGIHVELYNSSNNTLVKSTQTNIQGKYLFVGVKPAKYYIKFIIPSPWIIADSNIGSDTLDSDVNQINGVGTTETTMLMGGEDDRTWDLGLYKCVPIFGYVFLDLNRNGIYDFNENGINGLNVYIHDAVTGAVVQSVRSYSNATRFVHDGYYSMCLKPGNYYLRVQTLSGFFSSPYHQGTDPIYDSDLQDLFGLYTTGILHGASCDTIKDIGAGLYHNFVTTSILKERITETSESQFNGIHEIKLFGNQNKSVNELNWEVNQNLCLKFIQIYRKLEFEPNFQLIKVMAIDQLTNVDVPCDQYFIDDAVSKGSVSYWIKGLDEHFEEIQSNVLTLGSIQSNVDQLSIAPIPAQDQIYVSVINGKESIIAYQIVDGFGKLIRTEQISIDIQDHKQVKIDINNFPSGHYFFKAICKNKIYVAGFQVQ